MKEAVDKFFSSEAYAVVGVSENKHKFGSTAYRAMKEHRLSVYPVNTHLSMFEGDRCYEKVTDLPDDVQSVVIVVPPESAQQVLAECKWKGIQNVWLQPGSESSEALSYTKENGMNVVHGQCILMFLEPVKSIHALHRWVNRIAGRYPIDV
jgi:predicted CoA-binding protein